MTGKPNESNSAELAKLLKALDVACDEMTSEMSLHQLKALLIVALDAQPRVPLTEIGEQLKLSTAALTRNVDALADGFRTKNRGFGVIDRRELEDRRYKGAALTPRGLEVVDSIAAAMKKEEARQARRAAARS